MRNKDILKDLNPAQKKAVRHFQGPALVLAGAGSGKTRVLTHRLAYLIGEYGIDPETILAVTFTNKAADEMKERAASLLGARPESWVGTFHSFAASILRKEAEKIGYNSNYVIYDTADQRALLKEILSDLKIDSSRVKPSLLAVLISNAKSDLVRPEDYEAGAEGRVKSLVPEVYREYEKRMRASNALDFDDLLMKCCQLFGDHERVKSYYQRKYRFLLIDEYQDVNNAQYRLSQHLTGEEENIFAVGDPDQSIYGFRGADISNILNFERDYPRAEVIRLERNYRSQQKILQAAQSVIENNISRKEKDLWSDLGKGGDVVVAELESGKREARYVGKEVDRLIKKDNFAYGDIAVLYRTNSQSRSLEDVFMKKNIPYQIVGGLKFYERREIKDMLAYLRLVYNPQDEASLLRVINTPRRGIGRKTQERVKSFASEHNISVFEAISKPEVIPGLSTTYERRVREFAELIEELRARYEEGTVLDLMSAVIRRTGYKDDLRQKDDKARERIENIGELHNLIREYLQKNNEGGLGDFLEEVKLLSDIDRWEDSTDHVTLMTLHSAKGLEFPAVFMVGMDEGIFPHENCLEDSDEVEEERRLCYVGMTRAQQQLYLTRAKKRRRYGSRKRYEPSRFLSEIDGNVTTREIPGGSRKDSFETGTGWSDSLQKSADKALDNLFTGGEDKKTSEDTSYQPGEIVQHSEFGQGEVLKVSRSRQYGEKIKVRFADGNEKELMVSYAPLEKKN
ncbi:ATP-dependent helicase [Halarsenatibacter silvermanii]|uniref:ATP-dependent DNA helicase PcrA n=1 Tax=Halarsenatibacter silvermanii TaxID=321763 RepID=A0A1G9NGG1_9FIRM|nr:UvrD-helicase domain-containing protein [Halarsenatibacter silvermanii]SDL85626.1 DNA helicase-2 / ATP-dependent DNA helicase PcrA [Halarsenatibacter silvermanii]